ncbi:MAG TPA: hypothetical protein VKQ72_21415, partial [Aggregatilineales bacterium]|nr:hypothetical protein [Aggregatilineales bacterium]
MSNSSSSPVVFRVQRGAVVFIILILALGALILAASSSSNSGVRGNVSYVAWSSSDNAIYLEHPADWAFPTPVPTATLEGTSPATTAATEATTEPATTDYSVTVNNDTATQVSLSLLQTSGLDAIQTELVTANKFHNDAPLASQTIVVGNTRGVEFHQTRHVASTIEDTDAWVVPLDAAHVVVAWIQTTNWRDVEPLWSHMMSTLRVDRNAGLRALGIFTATPTPTLAPSATPAGTGAATAAATTAAASGNPSGALAATPAPAAV